eukprot:664235-Prymnesium_polylepis.1
MDEHFGHDEALMRGSAAIEQIRAHEAARAAAASPSGGVSSGGVGASVRRRIALSLRAQATPPMGTCAGCVRWAPTLCGASRSRASSMARCSSACLMCCRATRTTDDAPRCAVAPLWLKPHYAARYGIRFRTSHEIGPPHFETPERISRRRSKPTS